MLGAGTRDARAEVGMSALPRPDLPPGAHHDLVDALHDLHHRAGWPSLATLAAGPASPTPPSPRPSPPGPAHLGHPRAARRGAGRRPRAVPRALARRLHARPTQPPAPRIAGRAPSSPPYAATSRAAPGCSSSPARPASARPPRHDRRRARPPPSWPWASVTPSRWTCPLMPIAAMRGLSGRWTTRAPFMAEAIASLPVALLTRSEVASTAAQAPRRTAGRRLPQGVRSPASVHRGPPPARRPGRTTHPAALCIEDLHWADPVDPRPGRAPVRRDGHRRRGRDRPVVGTWREDDPTHRRVVNQVQSRAAQSREPDRRPAMTLWLAAHPGRDGGPVLADHLGRAGDAV